jgi:hypothetical protein
MKNKIINILATPWMQMISFSLLIFAGDKFGGPFILILFINLLFLNFWYSIMGILCYTIPYFIINKKYKFSILLQLITTLLMMVTVFSIIGYHYFDHFFGRFSRYDIILMLISYGFFIVVNLAVVLKAIHFFKSKIKNS